MIKHTDRRRRERIRTVRRERRREERKRTEFIVNAEER